MKSGLGHHSLITSPRAGTAHLKFSSGQQTTRLPLISGLWGVSLPSFTHSNLCSQVEAKSIKYSAFVPFSELLIRFVCLPIPCLFVPQKSNLLQKDWPEGFSLASAMNFKFPVFSVIAMDTVVSNAGPDGISLLTAMLYWNPSRRPTTASALRFPYFQKQTQSHMHQPNRRVSSHMSSHSKSSIPVTQSDYQINETGGKEISTIKSSLTYSELGNVDDALRNGNNSDSDPVDSLVTRVSGAVQQSRSSTDSTLTRASALSIRESAMSRSHGSRVKTNSRSAGQYAKHRHR